MSSQTLPLEVKAQVLPRRRPNLSEIPGSIGSERDLFSGGHPSSCHRTLALPNRLPLAQGGRLLFSGGLRLVSGAGPEVLRAFARPASTVGTVEALLMKAPGGLAFGRQSLLRTGCVPSERALGFPEARSSPRMRGGPFGRGARKLALHLSAPSHLGVGIGKEIVTKIGLRRPSPAGKKRHALARQRRIAARRRQNRAAGQRRRN